MLGLDYHIGFIEVENETVWFIHSNYFTPNCVVKEKADASYAFASSNYRIVGKLNNETTIKKWLQGQTFSL
ncbi:MAG: hypothetical protein LRY27_04015 [Chitinophagales bacterium]|nr:hypothetical protein [Chitinophagales bacterium]